MIVRTAFLLLLLISAGCFSGDQLKPGFAPTKGARTVPRSAPTGALFTVVTQPGYVTEVPRGPTTVRYGYRCYAQYFCIGEKDIGSISLSSPVVAVSSVDLKSMNYQVYSIYEVIVNGWSRDAWQKKYGSIDNIPAQARIFTERVELKDGRILANVMTQRDGDRLLVVNPMGVTQVEDLAQVIQIHGAKP